MSQIEPLGPSIGTGKRRRRGRWWLAEDAPAEHRGLALLRALQEDADAVLASPASLARERMGRKRFYRVQGAAGTPALFVKIYRVEPGWSRLRSVLRPSKAQLESNTARLVRARGFEAVVPLAIGEERRLGALRRSLLVSVEREGRDLRRLLSDPALDAKGRRALVESFGALNRRLHDKGIDQDDTSPNNFLVAPDGRFLLIDFERCSVGPPLPDDRRTHLLAKLVRHPLGTTRTLRLRFLRSYQGERSTRASRREACLAIERHFVEIRRRDARRAAEGAFQPGRHIARTGDGYLVRGRESWPTELLAVPADEARRLWVLAQQLERLALPALRPVRLSDRGLELERPAPGAPPPPRAVAAARASLERFGRFTEPPEFAQCADGARLRTLRAYRLDLSAPPA